MAAIPDAEAVAESTETVSAPIKDRLPTEGEGTDWVAGDETNNVPEGFSIKGNASSRIYHPAESSSYDHTVAELYFATPEAAERAGYRLPKNLQAAADAAGTAADEVVEATED